jgi:hypothetical protein
MERRGLESTPTTLISLTEEGYGKAWFGEYTYHSYIPQRAGMWKDVVWRVHLYSSTTHEALSVYCDGLEM